MNKEYITIPQQRQLIRDMFCLLHAVLVLAIAQYGVSSPPREGTASSSLAIILMGGLPETYLGASIQQRCWWQVHGV